MADETEDVAGSSGGGSGQQMKRMTLRGHAEAIAEAISEVDGG